MKRKKIEDTEEQNPKKMLCHKWKVSNIFYNYKIEIDMKKKQLLSLARKHFQNR